VAGPVADGPAPSPARHFLGAPADPSRWGPWGLGDVGGGIVAAQFLAAACGIVAMGVAGWDAPSDVPLWGLALLQLPMWAGWVGALVVAGRKGQGVVAEFGLRAQWLDVPVGLAVGVVLQLVVLPLVYLPVLALLGKDTEDLSRPAKELAGRADGAVGWVLLLLLVGIGAPVVEEVFYRGLFQRALLKRGLPVWASVVLGSAVFAAMHLEALQFLGLFVFGLVAGALAWRTGRLGPSIAAHVGFNVTTVVTLWLTR
jgi:membrane protease YdiL (CAAX protease family)